MERRQHQREPAAAPGKGQGAQEVGSFVKGKKTERDVERESAKVGWGGE